MGVPAVVVTELTKCGGHLLSRTVGDIAQFNIEKINLKANVIKAMGELITVYESNNKIYIESSEKTLEKIIKAIPPNADPNQVLELLIQTQKGHNTILRTGMKCGTVVISFAILSTAHVLAAAMGRPITIHNSREFNLFNIKK